MSRDVREAGDTVSLLSSADEPNSSTDDAASLLSVRQQMNDSDCERHFNGLWLFML